MTEWDWSDLSSSKMPSPPRLVLLPTGTLFKKIFEFTSSGNRDCVAAVERLPCRFYFLVMDSIAEL